MVLASRADFYFGRVFLRFDELRKRNALFPVLELGFGVKCRAVGTHQFGNVGKSDLFAGEFFENADDREVFECPALNDDVVAELFYIFQFENFEKAVLDDRI